MRRSSVVLARAIRQYAFAHSTSMKGRVTVTLPRISGHARRGVPRIMYPRTGARDREHPAYARGR
jgi:hypothetical protein